MLAASYEAKAYGVRTAMGGATGPAAVPARGRGARRGCRPTRRRARRSSRSSTTPRRWSRGSRSTRPSSTSVGWAGSRGRRWRSPCACAARSSSGSACPSRSAWRGRSSSPRWPAAWPSPTACSWCRPAASSPSCTRCRSSGCGASGPITADKLRDRGITTVGQVARLAETALVAMSGAAAGRQLHALAHNRDPRPVQVGRRRRSIGRAARARARAPSRRRPSTPSLVGLVDRLARRLRGARRVCRTVVLRLRFDDFSRATRSHTLAQATRRPSRSSPPRGPCWPRRRRRSSSAGLTLVGVALGNLEDDARDPARAPLRPSPAPSTRRSTACATGSGRLPSPAPCCSAATRAWRSRCCPTDDTAAPEPPQRVAHGHGR